VDRLTLERRQVWIYLSAIIVGLLLGSAWPGVGTFFETLLWPALMLLLYTTFLQVPLLHLREAFLDHRFVAAVFLTADSLTWQIALKNDTVPRFESSSVFERPLLLTVPCFQSYCKVISPSPVNSKILPKFFTRAVDVTK
jgi:hypothetical protein